MANRGFAPERPSPLSAAAHPGVPADVLDMLREFALFKNAPPSFFKRVASVLRPARVSPETYVITEGEEARAMYWLVKGRVGITSLDGEAIYAELRAGTYFGEIGVLFGCPRTANVVAKAPCLVLSLSARDLRSVLPQYPEIEAQMRSEARRRLDMTSARNRHKRKRSNSSSDSGEEQDTGLAELQDRLRKVSLFRNLPDIIMGRLADAVQLRHYAKGEYIFRQDSVGSDLYFVTKGTATVLDEAGGGTVKAMLGEGAYFGEMAFLALSPARTASIYCFEPVDCLVVTGEVLKKVCAEFPHIQREIRELALARAGAASGTASGTTTTTQAAAPAPAPVPPLTDSNGNGDTTTFFSNSWQMSAVRAPSPSLRPNSAPLPARPLTPDRPASSSSGSNGSSSGSGSSGTNPPSVPQIMLHPRLKRQTSHRRGSLFNVGALPDPILVRVFAYLSLSSMMRMRAVCQRWRDLLTECPQLLTTLDLSPYNRRVNDASIVPITDFAGLRPKVVDVSHCFHLTDDGFSYLVNGIGLARVVRFRMRSVWDVSSLAILDLTVPSIGGDLEEVDVSNCRNVSDQTVARLLGWVVPEFEPDGTPVTCPPPGTVVGCPRLKRLSLGYCKHVTDRAMYHIAAYAADRIEALDLTRCTSITDTGFSYWGSARAFPRLRDLKLADCTFLSDASMSVLAAVAPELEHLNLSFCCSLTDMAVYVLAVGCQKLRSLDLSFCGSAVSDASLSTIAVHLKLLERLVIRGCVRVTDAGIAAVRAGCPRLTYIDATQCVNVHHAT